MVLVDDEGRPLTPQEVENLRSFGEQRVRQLEDALRSIKNDARLIRNLTHSNTEVANLATGIYQGARAALNPRADDWHD